MKVFELFLVGFGGLIGAVCRFIVTYIIKEKLKKSVPLANFSINILGSFLIGLSFSFFPLTAIERFLICSGFISSFTTFSTFIADIHEMHDKREYILNFLYIGLTILLGFLAVFLGSSILVI